jgi:hypothetical protein
MSDSIVPVLVSLYKWTPYYWECNRIGMLVPLLAMPFKHPLTNLLVQSGLVLFAAFAVLFLLPRYLLRTRSWPIVGILASALFLLLSSRDRLAVNTFGQPHYAVGLALALGAVLLTEVGPDGRVCWLRLPAALVLVLLAHWANSACVFFLGPLVALRGLLTAKRATTEKNGPDGSAAARVWIWIRRSTHRETVLALGVLAAGAAGCALLRLLTPVSEDPVSNGFMRWQKWTTGWAELAYTTWRDIFLPSWIKALALIVGASLALAVRAVRRQAGAPLRMVLALLIGGLVYGLFMGTLKWVELNHFCYKYMIPLVFFADVALAIAVAAPLLGVLRPRTHKVVGLLAVPALLLLVAGVHGKPSRSRARADLARSPWDPDVVTQAQDLVDMRATHLVGSYGHVWMRVFHANLLLYERGEERIIWGVTGRCIPTWHQWGRMPPEDLCVAAIAADLEVNGEADGFLRAYFPPLTLVDKRRQVCVFRPSDEVPLPSRPGHPAPVRIAWHSGFLGPQQDPKLSLCHCGTHTGKATLTNPSNRTRTVTLDFYVLPASWQPAHLRVEGPGFADEQKVAFTGGYYKRTLVLPPGKTVLHVSCDARRLPALADQFNIVFHILGFRLLEENARAPQSTEPLPEPGGNG